MKQMSDKESLQRLRDALKARPETQDWVLNLWDEVVEQCGGEFEQTVEEFQRRFAEKMQELKKERTSRQCTSQIPSSNQAFDREI